MSTYDIVLDLGSHFVGVLSKHNDILLRQRNAVALSSDNKIVTFGNDAIRAAKNNQSIKLVCPFNESTLLNPELAQRYFEWLFTIFDEKNFFTKKVRLLVIVNCGINNTEKRAWEEVLYSVGAKQIKFIESTKACAKFISGRYSQSDYVVADIGSAAADFGCVINGKMISGCSLYYAGNNMDTAIKQLIENRYNTCISLEKAEDVKRQCSYYDNDVSVITVQGINFESKKEENVEVPSRIVFEELKIFADRYCQVIKSLLKSVDEHIAERLKLGGVYFCGGVSLAAGLKEYMQKTLCLDIVSSSEGRYAAIYGGRMLLQENVFK